MFGPKFAIALASALLVAWPGFSLPAGEPRGVERPQQAGISPGGLESVTALLRDHVERKRVAGAVALVARQGKVLYKMAVGMQDAEAGRPMTPDSIFRIASMTKPVTSVAIMMLADAGKLDLYDPVSLYLPEFKFMKVAVPKNKGGDKPAPAASPSDFDLVAAYRPITVRDLLTHTSGLSYRMSNRPLLGELYAKAGICDGLSPCEHSLAENVRRLAGLPLLHQPGTAWEYGLNTDVLGRIVELASGTSLDRFFAERIFEPLKMNDTAFILTESKRDRLAALYEPGPGGAIARTGDGPTVKDHVIYSATMPYANAGRYFSGGAGLTSTAGDYARFLQMLANRGALEGARLLRPETIDAMTRNQTGSLPLWIAVHGQAFGYGFGVATQPGDDTRKDPAGTFSWGGIYYTDFWVDPRHDVVAVLLTQIYPSGHLKLRDDFHRLVNEAIGP
jgi:CubicO group peptidase (beta-lactamase class C family)